MKVKDIVIYPIKSLGGISLEVSTCTALGLTHDRRMMLADSEGKFVTQRDFAKMATIGTRMDSDGFVFFDKSDPENAVNIAFEADLGERKDVKVWKHDFKASMVLGDANAWFQEMLGTSVSLFKMDDESIRYKSLIKSPGKTAMSMADGYPYLLLSEASLLDLNSRLDIPVKIDRFRANIILEESEAYAEESLDKINIGEVKFRAIKPCARCSMITINQKTSEKLVEPLKTLSIYKKKGNNVYFGMNTVSLSTGEIKIGDLISEI